MKRKLLTTLFSLICAICMLGLVACEHFHTFASEWTTDQTHHWHAATCEHTTETDGKAEHTFEWKVDFEATEEVAGKQHQECTVCSYKTDLDTEIPKATHVHTFSGEWSKDATGHWHAATCSHSSEIKDKTGHTYNDNSVCTVCGYAKYMVDENAFTAAVLLENVTNFSYTREAELTEISKTTTNQNIPEIEVVVTEEFIATATRGYQRLNTSYGTPENYFHYVSFGDNSPEPTVDLPIVNDDKTYFSVENGREYIYQISDYLNAWVKSNFSDRILGGITYNSYIYSELSMFQEASRNFSAFTYDEQSKTYKNSQPMTVTEIDDVNPEEGVTTINYTNMYYEFKISDGVIEWMQLTCDASVTTIIDWVTYPGEIIYLYYNGELQGPLTESTQTGSMTVRYYNINNSHVESLPAEYVLDPNINDYWCNHSELKEVEALQSMHRQCCEQCNAMVVLEAHHFEDGECTVCGYGCLHQNVMEEYSFAVDNDYHRSFCMGCGEQVLVEHNYDVGQYCATCNHTYCEHTGCIFARIDNERHGFDCPNCQLSITENHNYVEGVCSNTDCGAVFCEHSGVTLGYTDLDNHYKYCNNCYDMITEPHTFDGDICTGCGYEICTHQNVYNDFIYAEGWAHHSYICADCGEEIDEEHSFEADICSVCGYYESCEHTNSWHLIVNGAAFHIKICEDCNSYEQWGTHRYVNGICGLCQYQCLHPNVNNEGSEPIDNYYHSSVCMDCNEQIFVEHEDDGEQYCAICEHTYCEHTGCSFARLDNERHGFVCPNCNLLVTENHNYNGNACSDCEGERCQEHNMECISYTHEMHDLSCSNCYDGISEPHTFEGARCTKCEYERCTHESILNNIIYIDFYSHSYQCADCWEMVDKYHSLDEGVSCAFCGYNINCEHDNRENVAIGYDDHHIIRCEDCNYTCDYEMHNNQDGVCQDCGHECLHSQYNVGICEYCGEECPHDEYDSGYCTNCGIEQLPEPN